MRIQIIIDDIIHPYHLMSAIYGDVVMGLRVNPGRPYVSKSNPFNLQFSGNSICKLVTVPTSPKTFMTINVKLDNLMA